MQQKQWFPKLEIFRTKIINQYHRYKKVNIWQKSLIYLGYSKKNRNTKIIYVHKKFYN